jgi:hypothetical protein
MRALARQGQTNLNHRQRQSHELTMLFPSRHTDGLADRILHELTRGRTLREVCQDDGMPATSTVRKWVAQDREGFATRYRQARKLGRAVLGRPTRCTSEIAERILCELSCGRTLTEVCGDPGMPACSTVRQWVMDDRDGFAARYRRARRIGNARTGRPTLYSADIADWILEQLSEARTLSEICGDPGMPVHSTVRLWARENREGFADRYNRAREFGCEVIADQIIQIADDSRGDWIMRRKPDGTSEVVLDRANIRRSRLRVSARCRLLSKLLPRIYGSRPDRTRAPKPKATSPR